MATMTLASDDVW